MNDIEILKEKKKKIIKAIDLIENENNIKKLELNKIIKDTDILEQRLQALKINNESEINKIIDNIEKENEIKYLKVEQEVKDEIQELEKTSNIDSIKIDDAFKNVENLDFFLNLQQVLPINNLENNKFTIKKILTVKEFITDNLQEHLVNHINKNFPSEEFNFKTDFKITINNLNDDAILIDNKLEVKLELLSNKYKNKILLFNILLTYEYDVNLQKELLNKILLPAIPRELFENKPNYNLAEWTPAKYIEISETVEKVIPLDWLLNEENLTPGVAIELFAASWWTSFHTSWRAVARTEVGSWPTYSTIPSLATPVIPSSNVINDVEKLFNTKQGYFHQVFLVIEKKLNSAGIKCTINKKILTGVNNLFAFAVGNLNFYNSASNQKNKEFDPTQRQFFIQINFDLLLKNDKQIIETKEYPGVVLLLSDILKIYK